MKLATKVKLQPTQEQKTLLLDTLRALNLAANDVSKTAREQQEYTKFGLQKLAYTTLKTEHNLGAQAAIRVLAKTVDAYKTHAANLKAGNYGKKGSKRYLAARDKIIEFRATSSQPYDDRILTWDHDTQTINIWVKNAGKGKAGRIRIPFIGAQWQLDKIREFRQGETDLIFSDGEFFLAPTLDIPDVEQLNPETFLGVDLGIVQIASMASEQGKHVETWDGQHLNVVREKHRTLRKNLQAAGTKSAKRHLKKLSGKEQRFAKNVNHIISKKIVESAERTGQGIALEDLTGIRDRARLRKHQQSKLHSWSFAQLGNFISYKAEQAGVPVVFVNPKYTSQTCSACGHVAKKNRRSQAVFACVTCGNTLNADENAAINIARRAQDLRAEVNQPIAA